MSARSEVRDLIKRIEREGYEVRPSGREHYKIYNHGDTVVDASGPVTLPSSPSSNRWRENAVGRLVAANVLPADPYKETRGTKANGAAAHRLASPEMQALKVAGVKAKAEKLRERTAKLRARLEPIVAKGGGWGTSARYSSGVSLKEFGEVVYHWATVRGRVELPKKSHVGDRAIEVSHVVQAAGRLKRPGQTLGETWLPLFEVFIDDLERNAGTPPRPERALERYFELLREANGVSSGPQSPAAGEPVEKVVAEPEAETEVEAVTTVVVSEDILEGMIEAGLAEVVDEVEEVETPYTRSSPTAVKVPSAALRALWFMARGANDDEQGQVVDLAAEIARLELGGS